MIQLILLYGLLFGTGTSDKEIPGTYVRRIQRNSDVRQFGRTLTLNCDSTVVATFQGDMMNEKETGHWSIEGDTLKVTIDSVDRERPFGHWNKVNLFLIKNNKLINIVTELKGQKITDKRLQDALYKESKKYAYDKTKKQNCD